MYIDMHCDTLYEIREERKQGNSCGLLDGKKLHCSVEKLIRGGCSVQNLAVFIDLKERPDPYENAMELVDIFQEETEKNKDRIRQVRTVREMEENRKEGILSALLTLEEGGMCCGEPEKLNEFYRRGARMMTLTWNYENELGYPGAESPQRWSRTEKRTHGLKETGFRFLEEMERLGMIIDVSHLSDDGFYDVLDHTTKPFVASHSNARALCPHKRNLTDDMLRQLGERGGVAGINFCPEFLDEHPQKENCLAQIASHALHMIQWGGSDCVGLGSDFDGFSAEGRPEDASHMEDLAWAFHKAGISDDGIDRILYENVLRLYRDILKE